ncbi:MAG: O-antigen ligase family protein, partial [Gemmataceae bacterium]
QFVPTGIKTIVHGGGYGMDLGVISGNSELTEGSTLAAVTVMMVPIILYLRSHGVILPKSRITDAMYLTLVVLSLAATIGTYARTGLIAMLVMGVGLWLRSRRKALMGVAIMVTVAIIAVSVSGGWDKRIGTITTYRDNVSSLSRILVWKWTLGFAGTHPFGGGFRAYMIDHVTIPADISGTGQTVIIPHIAYHSIYFDMLGTQGWVGLALFFGLVAASYAALQGSARRARKLEGMGWCRDLAFALQVSLATLLTGGAFVDLSWQPMLYYMFALSACLRHHVRKAEKLAHGEDEAPRWAAARLLAGAHAREPAA